LSVIVTPKLKGVPRKESGSVVAELVVGTAATGMVPPPAVPEAAANCAPPVAVPEGAAPESAGTKPAALGGTGLYSQENDRLM
jgi:hypothetical protein